MKVHFPVLALFLFACESDKGVTIFNPNPEAQISSHSDGDAVLEGYVITFMGNVSDANHTPDELTTIWKSGTDILCEATVANIDGTSVCEAVLTPDDTSITLEVKDTENAPGSDTISLNVIPSANPTAEIIAPEANGVYYSDQLITFEGLLSDEEDEADLLVANWNSNLDGDLLIATQPSSTGEVLGATYLSQGDHFLVLTVEDTTGKEGSDNVTIRVGPPNTAPECAILLPVDGSAGPQGNAVQFEATASDVDIPSDMLTVTWSSDKDGELGSSTPTSAGEITFSFSDLSVNQHNITMTVTDEVGATCTTATNYIVGTPPAITIDEPLDGATYAEGDVINFSATISDAQDQPDAIALDWTLNGTSISTQGATSTGTAAFSDATLVSGAYNLVVTATDTDGLTDSDQINFTINGLPTQPVLHIEPEPAYTSDTLTVVLDTPSTDPEGSTINYTYEWLLGGAVQSSYTSSTVPSSATSKNEQWTVRVTPNDGIADGPAGEATITVSNTPPTLSGLVITPASNIYNDITLTCSVVVSDPDEAPSPTYEWSIGSNVVANGSTLNLTNVGASPGDVVTCTASVTDGDGATASGSTTTTIENRVPVVDSISLTPSLVYTNDSITATAVFSDDDDQNVSGTYAWHVIDAATGTDTEVQNSSDNTLSGVGNFDRDDEVYVIVTPNDGMNDGTPQTSTSTTIVNTPPDAPSISITPDPASTQDDLICSVDTPSTDADGDSVVYTYVWTDDSGTVQQTTSSTTSLTDTLLASGTSEGIWTCEVTPNDGTDDGSSSSASIEVEGGCIGSGLVMDLDFDTGAPLDVGPFGHTVAIEASVPSADRFLNPDRAWNFLPDVNSRLIVSPSNDLVFTDELSVSMYVRFNQPWNFHAESLLWKFPHPSSDGFHLGVDQNSSAYGPGMYQLSFLISSAGTNATKVMSYSEISDWFHVVGTFDQGVAKLYVDGQLVATDTGTSTIVDSLHELYVGGSSHPVSGAYNRDVDNIQIHNCALSEEEILTLYEDDADGDGFAAGEDCDDNDPSITTQATGSSSLCPSIDCMQILDDGFSTGDGYYWIDPTGSETFEVYCDMTTDGGGWTRIESYDFVHRSDYANQAFSMDFPRNPTTQGWDDYRLPQSQMGALLDTSSEVHARCHRDFSSSQSDYIFANIALVRDTLSGTISSNGSNPYNIEGYIRGYDVQSHELWFYGEFGNYHQHVDGSRLPQSATSEDNFGWADSGGTNTDHLCHTSAGEIVWMVRRDLNDADGDGVTAADDCNDNDASIFPLAGDIYGDGIDSDCDGFDCEADYDASGTYFNVCVDTTQRTFSEVEVYCLDGGYDGVSLPLIAQENDWIFGLSLNVWANKPISNYSIRLGGTDAQNEGTWLHDRTGTPLSYVNWAGSEPNNGSGNEHCINIIGDITYNGLWQDLGCHAPSNAAYSWSCEKR